MASSPSPRDRVRKYRVVGRWSGYDATGPGGCGGLWTCIFRVGRETGWGVSGTRALCPSGRGRDGGCRPWDLCAGRRSRDWLMVCESRGGVWPSVRGEDGGSRRRDLCAGRRSRDWPLVCESRRGDARRSGDLAVEPSVRGRSASVNSLRGDGRVVTRAGGASGPAEKCKQRG